MGFGVVFHAGQARAFLVPQTCSEENITSVEEKKVVHYAIEQWRPKTDARLGPVCGTEEDHQKKGRRE